MGEFEMAAGMILGGKRFGEQLRAEQTERRAALEFKLVVEPADVLHRVCYEVTEFDCGLAKIVAEMRRTMKEYGGIGLAAPQVGLCERIVVFDVPSYASTRYMINPRIVSGKRPEIAEEGCLSLPSTRLLVRRNSNIRVEWQDLSGMPKTMRCNQLLARAIQHEIDHLDGILITDRAKELE